MVGYRSSVRRWAAIATALFGIVRGSYLATPEFQWSVPLVATAMSNVFQKGNAIVPIGSDRLAITSSTGSLYLVSPNDVKVSNTTGVAVSNNAAKSFTPSLVNGMDSILCSGGIISVVSNSKTDIVMYAITDTDSQGLIASTSRILAVDASTAQLVWNTTIDGVIAGTPVVSENGFLYVVHNVESTATQPNSMTTAGVVSIFQLDANVFAGSNIRPKLVTKLPTESTGSPIFGRLWSNVYRIHVCRLPDRQ
jgi:outer membrane protein assembly factor BamB